MHPATLGILGGTFDPIHYGHLAIAEEARERFGLARVLFMPTGAPPHKPTGRAGAEHRYAMTVLATADNPAFAVSRLEIDRPGLSYTVDTLRALHEEYPGAELYMIIGADMALEFHTWRDPEGILAQATVVAATRPGWDLSRLASLPTAGRILPMDAPGLYLSSTALRARIAEGRSLRYLTPPPVAAYIREHGLYRPS
jgi:nicotinate-nucleotide adenylyltransferase